MIYLFLYLLICVSFINRFILQLDCIDYLNIQHVSKEEDPFVPTNQDLAGFWDMVHIQVYYYSFTVLISNLEKLFDVTKLLFKYIHRYFMYV